MSFAAFDGTRRVPVAVNEPVRSYTPSSVETKNLKLRLDRMAAEQVEIPLVIGGRRIHTGDMGTVTMPCDHHHVLATYHKATPALVHEAIAASAAASAEWASWRWEDRAAVFLRAAELLATKHRQLMNAATMLGQSKTAHQAEIDAAAGIEVTTGPLGQGIANALGMAVAEAWLNARFGSAIVDHRTYALRKSICLPKKNYFPANLEGREFPRKN